MGADSRVAVGAGFGFWGWERKADRPTSSSNPASASFTPPYWMTASTGADFDWRR